MVGSGVADDVGDLDGGHPGAVACGSTLCGSTLDRAVTELRP